MREYSRFGLVGGELRDLIREASSTVKPNDRSLCASVGTGLSAARRAYVRARPFGTNPTLRG